MHHLRRGQGDQLTLSSSVPSSYWPEQHSKVYFQGHEFNRILTDFEFKKKMGLVEEVVSVVKCIWKTLDQTKPNRSFYIKFSRVTHRLMVTWKP